MNRGLSVVAALVFVGSLGIVACAQFWGHYGHRTTLATSNSYAYIGEYANPANGSSQAADIAVDEQVLWGNPPTRHFALHTGYYGFTSGTTLSTYASDPQFLDDMSNGRTPVVSWHCTGSTASGILAGNYNTTIDAAAAQFVQIQNQYPGQTIILRWWWDPNLNHHNANTNGNNCFSSSTETWAQEAAEYTAVWHYLVDRIYNDGARDVTYDWNISASAADLQNPVALFYPGDPYVDLIGGDNYDYTTQPSYGFVNNWSPFVTLFKGYHKPLMIADSGEFTGSTVATRLGATVLSSNSPETVTVLNSAGIAAGESLLLDSGAFQERDLVDAVPDSTHITLDSVKFSHNAGANVAADTNTQAAYFAAAETAIKTGGAFYPYVKIFDYDNQYSGCCNWTTDANGEAAESTLGDDAFFNHFATPTPSPTPTPTITPTPTPTPSSTPGVTYVNSWHAHGQGTTVTVPVSPLSGDLAAAAIFTYNSSGCANVSTSSNTSGFQLVGTPQCTSSRNEWYVFLGSVAPGVTSYTFNINASGTYWNAFVLDLANANSLDKISAFLAMPSSTTVAAPNTSASQVNDLTFSGWGSGYQPTSGVTCSSPCGGTYTPISDAGGTYATLAWSQGLGAGTVNAPSATYGTAPTSGQTFSLTVQEQIVTPTPSPTPTPTPSNVQLPPTGSAYLGLIDNADARGDDEAQLEGLETSNFSNKRLSAQLTYGQWNNITTSWVNSQSQMQGDLTYNRIPNLSWTCGDSLANIATASPTVNTADYASIKQTALALKAYKRPVMLRFFHEFNLDLSCTTNCNNGDSSLCFGGTGSQPTEAQIATDGANFVAAWQNIHAIFQSLGATNVSFEWCPNDIAGGLVGQVKSYADLAKFYPGSAYVDWIGMDRYDKHIDNEEGFKAILLPWYQYFSSYGKPMMISETNEEPSGDPGYDPNWTQATFYSDMLSDLSDGVTFPLIRWVNIFDSKGAVVWYFDTPGLNEFATVFANSFWIQEPPGPTPTPAPTPTPTAPPQRDYMGWMGEVNAENVYTMHYASSANLKAMSDLCIGGEDLTTTLFPVTCPGPKKWGYSNGYIWYMEAGMGQPSTAGHDVDPPFGSYANASGKTCDAAAKTGNGNFWSQQTSVTLGGTVYTLPDYTSAGALNWFLYVNGGTIGDVHYMGWGWTGKNYYLYLNLNSASLLAYTNDVIDNCAYNTTYASNSAPFDAGNPFQDNTYIGQETYNWDKWDLYPAGKNFGTGSVAEPSEGWSPPTPAPGYADPTFGASGNSFVPSTFFNNESHTRTTLITSNDIPINFPNPFDWATAQTTFLGSLVHANGSPALISFNGYISTDQTLMSNTNTRFGIWEEGLVGCFSSCAVATPQPSPWPNGPVEVQIKSAMGTDLGMKVAIENISALYQETVSTLGNTQASAMFLGDQPANLPNSTSTTSLGTGIHQQAQMWEYAPAFLLFTDDAPNLVSEFSDMCGFIVSTASQPATYSQALGGSNCMDIWPFDLITPQGRRTLMPADPAGLGGVQPCSEAYSGTSYNGTGVPCKTGGPYDTRILAGGTSGLYRSEYSNVFAWESYPANSACPSTDTTYTRSDYPQCAVNIAPGGMCVIANGSGGPVTVSAANIASWCPNTFMTLNRILVPCTPTTAYWGSGAGAPVYAMPQQSGLGYGTGPICSGTTGDDVPSGGTYDYSKLLSDITSNSQILYDGQVLYIIGH